MKKTFLFYYTLILKARLSYNLNIFSEKFLCSQISRIVFFKLFFPQRIKFNIWGIYSSRSTCIYCAREFATSGRIYDKSRESREQWEKSIYAYKVSECERDGNKASPPLYIPKKSSLGLMRSLLPRRKTKRMNVSLAERVEYIECAVRERIRKEGESEATWFYARAKKRE